MRFLLLCPVALILLTAPAKTQVVDSHSSTTYSPTRPTSSPQGGSVGPGKSTGHNKEQPKPILDKPESEKVKRLRKKNNVAQAEFMALIEEIELAIVTLKKAQDKTIELLTDQEDLVSELNVIGRKIREAQDKLNTEIWQDQLCEPKIIWIG